jgi:hypothetical protein
MYYDDPFHGCRVLTVPLGVEDSNSLVVAALLLIQKLTEVAPANGWKPDL